MYLKFDKQQLVNLEYSLYKEDLRTNRAGSYASSTIVNCHTRKYHGLLVSPIPALGEDKHVLISSLDETVIQMGSEFHLAVRKFPGRFHPGHKYITDYQSDPIPSITYQVGSMVLKRELCFVEEEETVMLRYTMLEQSEPVTIKFHPFMAFRSFHQLRRQNIDVNTNFDLADNGIKYRMYDNYPFLYMQYSSAIEYVHAPMWFNNVEYIQEQARGYDFQEDLFVCGYFETKMKKGDVLIFSASLSEQPTKQLKKKFEIEVAKRTPRNSFENCLENAAQQFFVKNNGKIEILAGYHWFGSWGRDTFISLPGLTLATSKPDVQTFKTVMDTMSEELNGCLFRNIRNQQSLTNSVDAPLWYFWTIQQYLEHYKDSKEYDKIAKEIWKNWGAKMKQILEGYKSGTDYNIKMHENGLIWSGADGVALTWMDAVINGNPVTPRTGYAVEISSLWYNAVQFSLELATKSKDKSFVEEWKELPKKIEEFFTKTFWDDSKKYLADVVGHNGRDWSVRPNQIFAACLPYSPITEEKRKSVLDLVMQELVVEKGVRTLSPQNSDYRPRYEGDNNQRNFAYHNGTAWPWLLSFFCEGYLKIYGQSKLAYVKKLYTKFEESMHNHGIGTISEIYDGNPPHQAKGSLSQAWSVASLLTIRQIIDKYSKNL